MMNIWSMTSNIIATVYFRNGDGLHLLVLCWFLSNFLQISSVSELTISEQLSESKK